MEPQYRDEYDYDDILKLCEPYVHILIITELQHWSPSRLLDANEIPTVDKYPICHIDFMPILKHLKQLTLIDIVFGMNKREMKFDPHCYKVDPDDLERIAKSIAHLTNLRILRIHKSNIKCPHIKKFVRCVLKNTYITELDFSFCKIGNDGGKYLGKLITHMVNLQILILRGNEIEKSGVHGIAFALQEGSSYAPLRSLDLSLNPLGDDGMICLCSALMRCSIPSELKLCGVGLAQMAIAFASMLKYNRSLMKLDLALNYISEEAGKNFIEAMKTNFSLVEIDFRSTGMPEEMITEVNGYTARNAQLQQRESLKNTYSKSFRSSVSMDEEIGSTMSYSSVYYNYSK